MSKIIKKEIHKVKRDYGNLDLAHIFITRKCNMRCRHCYTNSNPSMNDILPFSFWENAIRQLSALKVRRIHVEGGEVFLHPDLDRIVQLLSELKFKDILVVTNGLLATKKRLESLKQCGLKKIAISLDSSIKSINDELRPRSYEFAIRAINNAVALGFHTRISCCLNRKNIVYIRSFIDDAYSMGVQTLNLDWFVGVGRGNALFDDYGITENDTKLLDQFEDDLLSVSTCRTFSNFNLCVDLPDWYEKRKSFLTLDVSRTRFLDCDAVGKQVSINEIGDVYPCFIFAYGDRSIGNLNDDTLVNLIKNSNFSCSDCPIKAKGHIFYKLRF